MTKNKTNWPLLGAVGGACAGLLAAPFTGGASLALTAKIALGYGAASGGLGFVSGSVVDAALNNGGSNDDNSKLDNSLEAWKIQMENWQNLVKAQQEEAKRLREEKEEERKKINHNNEEIIRLNAVINNPHSSEEEKSNARKRIVLLEDENKEIKEKLDNINKKLDGLETPPAPSKPWTWPKLKTMDKVILAGGIALVIYLLIPEDKKKR